MTSAQLATARHMTRAFVFGVLIAVLTPFSAHAEGLWVAGKVFNGYTRPPLQPDGKPQLETYAFASAGRMEGALANDSIDNTTFMDIARVLAPILEKRGYVASRSSRETKLMILVAWGTTQGSMEDQVTEAPYLLDSRNASILGFRESYSDAQFLQHMSYWKDVMVDLGQGRYFVVLKALDFQAAAKNKKLVPLWEARFSIPRQGVDFLQELPKMAFAASQYFGKRSGELIRPVPQGSVRIGEPAVVPDAGR